MEYINILKDDIAGWTRMLKAAQVLSMSSHEASSIQQKNSIHHGWQHLDSNLTAKFLSPECHISYSSNSMSSCDDKRWLQMQLRSTPGFGPNVCS